MRPTRDRYWMHIAQVTATRSTCSRLQVGAVLVRDDRLLGTGFNGAPRGVEHCTHSDDTPCTSSVHAEVNAIIFAQQDVSSSTLYVTHLPCLPCAGTLINAGIKECVYYDLYRQTEGGYLLRRAGISLYAAKRSARLPKEFS